VNSKADGYYVERRITLFLRGTRIPWLSDPIRRCLYTDSVVYKYVTDVTRVAFCLLHSTAINASAQSPSILGYVFCILIYSESMNV
jgi:hypothetical protein